MNCKVDDLYYISPKELNDIFQKKKRLPFDIINERRNHLVQVIEQPRIETMFAGDEAKDIINAFKKRKYEVDTSESKEIKGIVASYGTKGNITGKVRIVLNPEKAKFNEGEILVASMTRPEYVPLMKKATAIITDEGGITSHASIVSRELKIPCIVGTKIATKILKDGDLIEINADIGIVRKLK